MNMPALQLSIQERKAHRADAHHLDPVVQIGANGLTAAVKKEIDAALKSHGLIKVRVASDDREERAGFMTELCESLSAAPIQSIGKLLILWRPKAEKEKAVDEDRMPGPKNVRFVKTNKDTGRRDIKKLTVLGNQRLTKGGTIKRAKVKQKSLKKGAAT
jgi:RNA-binding protein